MNGLGVETHLVYRGDKLLKHFDHATSDFVAHEMQKKGITIHYNTNVEHIEKLENGRLQCKLDNGQSLTAGQVMYATGRSNNK